MSCRLSRSDTGGRWCEVATPLSVPSQPNIDQGSVSAQAASGRGQVSVVSQGFPSLTGVFRLEGEKNIGIWEKAELLVFLVIVELVVTVVVVSVVVVHAEKGNCNRVGIT
jgi:hypothetical protein